MGEVSKELTTQEVIDNIVSTNRYLQRLMYTVLSDLELVSILKPEYLQELNGFVQMAKCNIVFAVDIIDSVIRVS